MSATEKLSAEDAAFDALHGGRDLLPIEQVACEAEGAERFAKFHGHGRSFPKALEQWATLRNGRTVAAGAGEVQS